jgi:UDP-2-acetamido-3-amino-2,3-dideoxy-glucuronate N-acetyltransferase
MATATVHPSAIVDDGAIVGDDTKIWHFCHVASGARIGQRCVLGQNVYVASTARIADGVRIQNNVSIYDGVSLAADVFVGPSAVFTNVVRPRANVSRKDEFAETHVGRGVTIGANATIVCGTKIAEHAFIGAGAVVTRDVLAHAIVVGNPARQRGWACRCGERLPEGTSPTCSRCQSTYEIKDGRCASR